VSILLEGAAILVLAGLVAIIVALAFKLFRGAGDRTSQMEDTRLIQELYQGLSRLEQRVESLETILADRDRKERSK
jgi:phage shock protein B